MRLVSATMLGTALVAAGMLAPAPGGTAASGRGGVVVAPDVARPGQRVEVSVPGCSGPWAASSKAFAGRTVDGGEAIVERGAKPDAYPVVARCGSRRVTGEVRVAGRLVWPDILPADRGTR